MFGSELIHSNRLDFAFPSDISVPSSRPRHSSFGFAFLNLREGIRGPEGRSLQRAGDQPALGKLPCPLCVPVRITLTGAGNVVPGDRGWRCTKREGEKWPPPGQLRYSGVAQYTEVVVMLLSYLAPSCATPAPLLTKIRVYPTKTSVEFFSSVIAIWKH